MAEIDIEKGVTTVYELGYLVLPSIAEEELEGVAAKLKSIISKAGGSEIDGELPERVDLAYTMTKTVGASRYVVNDAYIGWIKFEVEPAQALKIKEEAEKVDEILRLLLIKAPRETDFSFAKARKAQEEKNRPEEAVEKSGEEAPAPVEEQVVE